METAVECINVIKRFGNRNIKTNRVLNGFSIKIPKGKIFSLLGPSGCGKTTLLRCIIGETCVDSGYLSVFGEHPHAGPWIGYMPQSTSLSDNLTVDQTLWLYGRLTGLSAKKTKERAEVMLRLLSMTAQQYAMVGTLSGGEKRRVSFAVALLNEAPLLILDEPTVGVDPTLRQSIWEYLLILVRCTNTTVIITTHYIEEARNSDFVGFMQEGHLLAYSSPNRLMTKYQCPTLEDVFLHLNLTHTEDIEVETSLDGDHSSERFETADDEHSSHMNQFGDDTGIELKRKYKTSCKNSIRFSRVFTLIRKWQMELFHSLGVIAALLLLPAIVYSLGPMVDSGKPHDINIGVVNMDSGDFGKKYIDAMDNDIFKKISYDSYEVAVKDARLGKLLGVIMFTDNVTASMNQKNPTAMIGNNDTTIQSNVYISLDKTKGRLSEIIERLLIMTYQKFTNLPILVSPGLSIIKFTNDMTGEINENKRPYATIITIISMSFITWISITALLLVFAQQGQLKRLYVTGVTSTEFILSLSMHQSTLVVPFVAVTMFVSIVVNGIECKGSLWLLALVVFIHCLSGIFTGILIASISVNTIVVIWLMDIVLFIMILLEGMTIPLKVMSGVLKAVSFAGPSAFPFIAMEGIVNYGWTITNNTVLMAFLVDFCWIIGSLIVCSIAFYLRK